MPNVPVAPVASTPVGGGLSGAHHQVIKVPAIYITGAGGPAIPVPVGAVLKGGTTGTAYSETISAQGGASPYTFSVFSGTLPTGTSLNGSTGVISGTTSAAGTYTFTIKVTDTNGSIGTQSFSITISAPVSSASNYGFVA